MRYGRTPGNSPALAPFNPITTTPVQGVNWNYNSNSPRTLADNGPRLLQGDGSRCGGVGLMLGP